MEIMEFIASCVKRKTVWFYLFMVLPAALILFYIFGGTPHISSSVKFGKFCYYASPFALTFISYIWLYFAPVFCDNLKELKDAFRGNEAYETLYDSYMCWIRQFDLNAERTSSPAKLFFLFGWFIACACLDVFLFRMDIVPEGNGRYAYGGMMVIVIILNFSSYYNCVVFVYFIMRVQKLELPHNQICPSATYGFQQLEKAANTIYMFFLLDSSLCTIAYVLFLYLYMSGKQQQPDPYMFGFTTVFLGVFGLLSWVGISFLLKTYLRRIHTGWKMKSLLLFQNKLFAAEAADDEEGTDRISARIEKLCQDKISRNTFETIVSIITFLTGVLGATSSLWAPLI